MKSCVVLRRWYQLVGICIWDRRKEQEVPGSTWHLCLLLLLATAQPCPAMAGGHRLEDLPGHEATKYKKADLAQMELLLYRLKSFRICAAVFSR